MTVGRWMFCIQQQRMSLYIQTPEWSQSHLSRLEANDTIHIRFHFENGGVDYKKNRGKFWNVRNVELEKDKNYSFAIHVCCEGTKMQLIHCARLI